MARIKICGITSEDDARLAASFGADEIGLNFFPPSPRYVSPEAALEITRDLPVAVQKIGVFVNEPAGVVAAAAAKAGLDGIQLHGDETAGFVDEIAALTGLTVIKAFRVGENFELDNLRSFNADAFLLDSASGTLFGGSGEVFEWDNAKLAANLTPRLYLAGGIDCSNVLEALAKVNPFAVDVCSGSEVSPGIKDREAVIELIAKVKWQNPDVGSTYFRQRLRKIFLDYDSDSYENPFERLKHSEGLFALFDSEVENESFSEQFGRFLAAGVDDETGEKVKWHESIKNKSKDEETAFYTFFALAARFLNSGGGSTR